ncbi:hypothetical protein [Streptomyces sp. NPDC048606]|uniref:hypothetical protein n=1 Tax=Streptomyces sp. NPDC048606 TaxID=3154726 RepID=UPI00343EABDB
MPPTQVPADAGPPEDGPVDDHERVVAALRRAGFDTSPVEGDGLRVWRAPEGVVVGWAAREVLRPTVQVHGHEEDLSRFTSLTGLHRALRTALAVILREAGLDVAPHGEHLVVLRSGTGPTDGPADRATDGAGGPAR